MQALINKACHGINSLYTLSALGDKHTEVYIGLAGGVAAAIVLLVAITGVIFFVRKKRRKNTTELQVLVKGDSSPRSYGTVDAGNDPLNGNHPSLQGKPGAFIIPVVCGFCHVYEGQYLLTTVE